MESFFLKGNSLGFDSPNPYCGGEILTWFRSVKNPEGKHISVGAGFLKRSQLA
jgi:hypothetical protein